MDLWGRVRCTRLSGYISNFAKIDWWVFTARFAKGLWNLNNRQYGLLKRSWDTDKYFLDISYEFGISYKRCSKNSFTRWLWKSWRTLSRYWDKNFSGKRSHVWALYPQKEKAWEFVTQKEKRLNRRRRLLKEESEI